MKNLVLFLITLLLFQPVIAQEEELPEEYHSGVQRFINCIKSKDVATLSGLVNYPLRRNYPIPSISDSAEFVARFSEVFDDSLVSLISNSNVKKDWSEVGWRGIMIANGALWLDSDGKLIRVNYQSEVENVKEKELIEKDRNSLYPALQDYEKPELILETKKFRIRIDEMQDGTYRYASWNIIKPMSEEPEIVLKNGIVNFLGSGGNHEYVFTNEEYKYICSVNILGMEESAPADLTVMKGRKKVFQQDAIIVLP